MNQIQPLFRLRNIMMDAIKTKLPNFESIINELAKNENFQNFHVKFAEFSTKKNDGYMGEMIFFSIENEEQKRFFVMKLAQLQEDLRKKGIVQNMFKEEVTVYSKLFPEIKKIEKENGVDIFNSFVKMYWCSLEDKRECLIFENLNHKGFRLWDKTKPIDYDHAKLMVEEFAKFHAVTLAIKMKKPKIFENIVNDLSFILRDFAFQTNMIVSYKRNFSESLDYLEKQGRKNLREKLQPILNDYEKIYAAFEMGGDDSTILHADAWMGNFMFQYEGNKKPQEIRFLDFQATRTGHPLTDLSMVFYFNADENVLKKFDEFIEIYRKILCESGEKLGVDLSGVVPQKKDLFREKWRRDALFAVMVAPFYAKMQLAAEDESPVLSDLKNDFEGFLNFPIKNLDYYRRWEDVLVHYCEFL